MATLKRFVREYWFWLILPSLALGLLWIVANITAAGGDAPGSYAIM
jgi:hypothetical protein